MVRSQKIARHQKKVKGLAIPKPFILQVHVQILGLVDSFLVLEVWRCTKYLPRSVIPTSIEALRLRPWQMSCGINTGIVPAMVWDDMLNQASLHANPPKNCKCLTWCAVAGVTPGPIASNHPVFCLREIWPKHFYQKKLFLDRPGHKHHRILNLFFFSRRVVAGMFYQLGYQFGKWIKENSCLERICFDSRLFVRFEGIWQWKTKAYNGNQESFNTFSGLAKSEMLFFFAFPRVLTPRYWVPCHCGSSLHSQFATNRSTSIL